MDTHNRHAYAQPSFTKLPQAASLKRGLGASVYEDYLDWALLINRGVWIDDAGTNAFAWLNAEHQSESSATGLPNDLVTAWCRMVEMLSLASNVEPEADHIYARLLLGDHFHMSRWHGCALNTARVLREGTREALHKMEVLEMAMSRLDNAAKVGHARAGLLLARVRNSVLENADGTLSKASQQLIVDGVKDASEGSYEAGLVWANMLAEGDMVDRDIHEAVKILERMVSVYTPAARRLSEIYSTVPEVEDMARASELMQGELDDLLTNGGL